MKRERRRLQDGLRSKGRGRAGRYATLATAWPAVTTVRRGNIDITTALRPAAGKM
jgi:hypothetical protein